MAQRHQSTLTRKGQATIPIELREALGMKEGDKLIWSAAGGSLNVTTAREVVRSTAGIFKDSNVERPQADLDQLLKDEDEAIEQAMLENWILKEARSRG